MTIRSWRTPYTMPEYPIAGQGVLPEAATEQIMSLTEAQATEMSRAEDAPGPEEKHIAKGAPPTHTTAFKRR